MRSASFIARVKTALAVLMGNSISKRVPSTEDGALFDIYGREILDGSDYFHPNQVRGIPVFSVDTLMEQHKGYIKRIVRDCGVGDHHRTDDGLVLNDELYVAVIRRYIEYVHLLPASESHHHSVPGGLLIHSLEVSEIAYSVADDMKPATTGMLDIDKELEPSYKYAAWLGGLLHDAGKVVSDMTVFAVTIYDKETETNKKASNAIPTWQPERESLIQWAQRYSVATYSVTFNRNRIHHQHNFDTSVLFSPIIGYGAALDKILTQPVNIRNELAKVLSGHESKCEYLKKSIRVGDNKSTGDNLKIYQHLKLGPGKLSVAAMIYRSIQWSRPKWLINKANGHAWVIGDDVYLRYTSAFDVIRKTADDNGYHIANQGKGILETMADNNMIEKYSDDTWSVKYAGGVFTESEVVAIREGRVSVGWESVIKVMWRGVVFGSDPVPDSAPGIMLLPDTEMMIWVRTDGITQEFPLPTTRDVNELPSNDVAPNITDTQQVSPLSEPVIVENDQSSSTVVTSTVAAIADTKGNPPAKTNTKRKKLKFKNDPKKQEREDKPTPAQSQPKPSASDALASDVIQFWERAVFVKNAPKNGHYIHLNDSVGVLGMSLQELAEKAKEDGILVPNPAAPLKVVTMHKDVPCLHVTVKPRVSKRNNAIRSDNQPDVKVKEPEIKPEQNTQAVNEVEHDEVKSFLPDSEVVVAGRSGKSKDVWLQAKSSEGDYGLKMMTSATKSKHTLGYAINYVLAHDLGDDCFVQTAEGLLIDVSELSSSIISLQKYRTQPRTLHGALEAAEFNCIDECAELYLVPYAELNKIKMRVR